MGMILCWSFTQKRHRQLRVMDFPTVSTWRLERDSSPRPSVQKASTLPMSHHVTVHLYLTSTVSWTVCGQITLQAFFNAGSAFDSVCHSVFLQYLSVYFQKTGLPLAGLCSFLTDHTNCVVAGSPLFFVYPIDQFLFFVVGSKSTSFIQLMQALLLRTCDLLHQLYADDVQVSVQ